jgi:hypothetical protein
MNQVWLNRVVNTSGRPCPILKKKCPGSEAKCAFWITEQISNGLSQDIQAGCLFAFQYVVANSTQIEAIRLNSGFDKATNMALAMRASGPMLIEE